MSAVLVDTSVWVGHFRRAGPVLKLLLENDRVLCHPLIQLELACGTPPARRGRTLGDLKALRQSKVATTDETLSLSSRRTVQQRVALIGELDVAGVRQRIVKPDVLSVLTE